jgi:hypothetical protein
MNAAPITTREQQDALLAALATAELRCNPGAPAAPPEHLVRSAAEHGYVFVATDADIICGSAIVRDRGGEIVWYTHLSGNPAETLGALCAAISDAFGVEPWGRIESDETRAAVAHPELLSDADDPAHVSWRRGG